MLPPWLRRPTALYVPQRQAGAAHRISRAVAEPSPTTDLTDDMTAGLALLLARSACPRGPTRRRPEVHRGGRAAPGRSD
jgi:hypothetical protein